MRLEEEVGQLLRDRHLKLGVVESASGGLISHLITNISGSSDYFKGAIVSYSNEIKVGLVGVKRDTLEKYGAVSPAVAEEMARGGLKALDVDICLADTGIAGPGGATPEKPVGLFYIGLASGDFISSRRLLLSGDRLQNKEGAARSALEWLREYLLSYQK